MANIEYAPYTAADNEAALSLERQCVQGRSIALRFERPTFHGRSLVYGDYKIICARVDGALAGICAWAEKKVRYRGEEIRAVYGYDLRVHPEHRGQGVAKGLVRQVVQNVTGRVDCVYSLIAGENARALGLAQALYQPSLTAPFTYTILPVYKEFSPLPGYRSSTAAEVHESYLRANPRVEFVPRFDEARLLGHVMSITLEQPAAAGCSVWTNEQLLAERVVSLAWNYRLQRALIEASRPFMKLPYIPKPPETIRSWFLFDLFAAGEAAFHDLLKTVNNLALSQGRQFIYVLLQDSDPALAALRRSGFRSYSIPYYLLADGRIRPEAEDRLYIDIRDL